MNETSKEKRIPKLVITLIILGVVILAVVFVVLATVGDDVPTVLAPATQTSPGN